jgi:RNA polymerase sigma factor (sigma-70 family)
MEQLMAQQTETNLTEAEAIRKAKDGDAAAFEYLYNLHCRRVYGVCLRMVKNPAEAEDLTQQAFLQLFRKIGTFRGESGFSTWLHRVTVNVVLMQLDDPVSKYLEGFDNLQVITKFNEQDASYETRPAKRPMTIRHLLTHTSGIGYGFTNPIEKRLTEATKKNEWELPLLGATGRKAN